MKIFSFTTARSLFCLSAFIAVGSCAYTIDGSLQEMTVLTPGAEHAFCDVYVDGLRHKFRPPQTKMVKRDQEDLIVDCFAPGNRRKKLVIPAQTKDMVLLNAGTGMVPGLTWDYMSGAMFQYPSVIEIDFYDEDIRPQALPAHNNPEIKQPEAYRLEEFRPESPRLNSDIDQMPTEIRRRGADAEVEAYHSEELAAPDKGDLRNVLEGLNPAVPAPMSGDSADGGPTPLYQGQ